MRCLTFRGGIGNRHRSRCVAEAGYAWAAERTPAWGLAGPNLCRRVSPADYPLPYRMWRREYDRKRSAVAPVAMVAGGSEARYRLAQGQAWPFLMDRAMPEHVRGSHVRVKPWGYGPLGSRSIRRNLCLGSAAASRTSRRRSDTAYSGCTDSGHASGTNIGAGKP